MHLLTESSKTSRTDLPTFEWNVAQKKGKILYGQLTCQQGENGKAYMCDPVEVLCRLKAQIFCCSGGSVEVEHHFWQV